MLIERRANHDGLMTTDTIVRRHRSTLRHNNCKTYYFAVAASARSLALRMSRLVKRNTHSSTLNIMRIHDVAGEHCVLSFDFPAHELIEFSKPYYNNNITLFPKAWSSLKASVRLPRSTAAECTHCTRYTNSIGQVNFEITFLRCTRVLFGYTDDVIITVVATVQ